jgi:HD superfamily phosphohydrolase
VRDPIHGDIAITALEWRIIDTAAFQRLRYLMQLGPTHLVYPGAVHTRFNHSLGTLHWAERLVDIANGNFQSYNDPSLGLMEIEPYPHVLCRLCALLHDVAHMPFGHTLEDEGNLAAPEWEDNKRTTLWLRNDTEDSSEIASAIVGFLRECDISRAVADRLIADI